MNFITQKHLARRTVLKGLGAAIALPMLDAMIPARAAAQTRKVRLVAMEMVHGSAGNITPYPRKIVYLTLNAVSNHIRTPTRAEYIAHTDFRPIEPCEDGALLAYARGRQAKAA